MMVKAGLVSVSFRQNSAEEILTAAKAAGLECIEWGGDVHVPAGDTERARQVADLTRQAGLSVSSYGSYFRLGQGSREELEAVIASARALGTDLIRIWAGAKGSADTTEEEYRAFVRAGKTAAEIARQNGVTLCMECHHDTLTDDYKSTLRVITEIGSDHLQMYWQPNQFRSCEYNLEAANALKSLVRVVHVFHWEPGKRYSLCEGKAIWNGYFDILGRDNGIALLEFMPNNSIDELKNEAAALKDLLNL